jgi:hypothetical protein
MKKQITKSPARLVGETGDAVSLLENTPESPTVHSITGKDRTQFTAGGAIR